MAESRSVVMVGLILSAAVAARATPVPFDVHVTVKTVGASGLIPAANVPVTVCVASEPGGPCGRSYSGVTDSAGTLFFSGYSGGWGERLVTGVATIGGVAVRGVGGSEYHSAFLTIDPISEAAVEIVSGSRYSTAQLLEVAALVRTVNAATDFTGLSIEAAIARAHAVADADPRVRAALPTWTPTSSPTATPTPTPTPTRTLRPTGTPRPCTGDCTGDGRVEIDELITGVDLALGILPATACAAGYPSVPPDVADLITAVNNALYGCGLDGRMPDLVPVSVTLAGGPACEDYYGLPYCLSVCVANAGDANASPFVVSVGEGATRVTWRVAGLVAGDGECAFACGTGFEGSVGVDTEDDVPEALEDNNVVPFRIDTPTPPPRCPTPTPT